MKLIRFINILLILCTALGLAFIGATFIFPRLFHNKLIAQTESIAAPETVHSTSATPYDGEESGTQITPLPGPKETARFFPLPQPEPEPRPLPAEPSASELVSEPQSVRTPEIHYNESRLSYLGYTAGADESGTMTYLLKDLTFDDIFSLKEGSSSREFELIEVNEGFLIVSDGKEFFRLSRE